MTDNHHSITPPPELVYRLQDLGNLDAIELAYQAGADQELEACCEWLKVKEWIHPEFSDELRAARRPKPLSLKEQALEALDRMDQLPTAEDQHIIRRALESLPD